MTQIVISLLYSAISALFSPATYPNVIKIPFQIQAQSAVKRINGTSFILKIQAGRLISCLTAGINLPKKVVILPCFWKYFSDCIKWFSDKKIYFPYLWMRDSIIGHQR